MASILENTKIEVCLDNVGTDTQTKQRFANVKAKPESDDLIAFGRAIASVADEDVHSFESVLSIETVRHK